MVTLFNDLGFSYGNIKKKCLNILIELLSFKNESFKKFIENMLNNLNPLTKLRGL